MLKQLDVILSGCVNRLRLEQKGALAVVVGHLIGTYAFQGRSECAVQCC